MKTSLLEESRGAFVVLGPGMERSRALVADVALRDWPWLLDECAGASRTCRFLRSVRLVVQDEVARVIDLGRGGVYALDPAGTRMLVAALETGSRAMCRRTAWETGAPEDQVHTDWVALLGAFRRAGLVEEVRLRPRRHTPPSPLGVWFRLTLALASFRLLGWETTLRLWRAQAPVRGPLAPDDREPVISAIDALVRRSAARHPLNPQCKERALVSWALLRQCGLPARLVMGVALYPFEAHAWAECHGQVVGDDPGRHAQFVPVAVHE